VTTTLTAADLRYDDTGLSPEARYFYRVYAVNADGVRSDAATGDAATTPRPVANLVVTSLDTTTISLTWEDPNQAEFGHRVERRFFGAGPFAAVLGGTLPPNQTTFLNADLTPDTQGTGRVHASPTTGTASASLWAMTRY